MEIFDRYSFYRRAVQSPETDVQFLRDTYRELKGHEPQTLREDFCGTFAISCEWAKLSPQFKSYGVDIDEEPIEYGRRNYFSALNKTTQARVNVQNANVLSRDLPRADLVCAMNFSYYTFKDRKLMKSYFKNVHRTLNAGGIFVADCFGGPACQKQNTEQTKHRGFTYVWEQASFDPVKNEAIFHIHFKVRQKSKRMRQHKYVFTYDWRMWTIPELREIMHEAGFRKTHVYWEGTTRSGGGDGIFARTDRGEECEAWVAYVVGEK